MGLLEALAARLDSLGSWAPVLFILIYIVASIAFVPGAVLTLIAGALFGFARGVPTVFIGALLGSSAAFFLSRLALRDRVARWVARDPRAAAVSRAVGEQGYRVILLLRLSPVVPYNVLNYALGASTVRYRDFAIGSLGMLPATVLYTYYGKVAGDVTAVAAGAAPPRGPEYYGLLAVGLVATVGATMAITRAAKKSLAQRPGR